ncbi:MAG: DUF3810 domain-containing protein [Lachnospiraceae bacterium]|nr:DUF3810 domain-containing protein [Lachnospiraceae bacterium]
MKRKLFSKRERTVLTGAWVLIIGLNILAVFSRAFSDWHRTFIFPIIGTCYAGLTNLAFFSVGEWMILAGVLLVIGAVLALVLLPICKGAARKAAARTEDGAQADSSARADRCADRCRRYLRCFFRILTIVSFIMTINCYILYHTTSFHELYITGGQTREYTLEELVTLRDFVITNANELSVQMQRDEDGNVVYDGDIVEQAGVEMRTMGETYPLLQGYYPRAKQFFFSAFFSQQSMMGYYFPFSMEANYNALMYITNKPATICHELSHLKGFIYEDDANLIGYLACIQSEDPFFRYSGYLSVLTYLNNSLYESVGEDRETYLTYLQPNDLVKADRIFLTEEVKEEIEKEAVVDSETLTEMSQTFLDTNQKVQGIEQGIQVYGEVVERLLEYYDGILY